MIKFQLTCLLSVFFSPFIYCWLNESFKREGKKFFQLFAKSCKQKNSQSTEGEEYEAHDKLHTSVTAVENTWIAIGVTNETTDFIENWDIHTNTQQNNNTKHFCGYYRKQQNYNLNKTFGIIVSNCASNTRIPWNSWYVFIDIFI